MKSVFCSKYGSPHVLQLREVNKPVPKPNEILVKVHAASVTAADTMIRKGSPYFGRLFLGLMKPKNPVPGTGFSGVVESLGEDVKQFLEGDEVFGEIVLSVGTNAEYVCIPEDGLVARKPKNISHKEAAPVCDGALTSINFLKELAKIEKGQHVLIIGASGSLGTAAVQLAKHFGAKVTGVCSTSNKALVKALGADQVIDYTKEDYTKSNQQYDIVYDTVGKSSFPNCKNILNNDGIYISPVLNLQLLFQMLVSPKKGKKAKFDATGLKSIPELKIMLSELQKLLENGKLTTVIDKSYSLEEIVSAHEYVDTGRKKGNIVLDIHSQN
ncbi:NAD(P)-dependent alcohol dehydrogenase [Flexithrix dorotheae]|uniref:NAD(P)-dependent alcohol dehydrogenase n=1 Tax=Flexithrix dorotheae TaxID=70993 RepID=UPI0005C5FC90|nr:NAD(P)-dependent alcohol dehydrogenase [Flexithrix dorotheae]